MPLSKGDQARLGVVVIGRNEGDRLRRCLASVAGVEARVYVDSGSIDGSVAMATAQGVRVVELSVPPKFTAARARNAGLAQLLAEHPGLEYVQMVDGDCEVQPEWLEAGIEALRTDPGLGLVFGRRRERFPEQSIYNALCDDEWNVPVGEAPACGGDALFRVAALQAIGGYTESMIAGEDPEMAMRLRQRGWRLNRIEAEMTIHDANMLSFGQWWSRTRRAGHAFAELAQRHPHVRWPDWRRSCLSIVTWGVLLPALVLAMIAAALLTGGHWLFAAAAFLFLLWPFKVGQIARLGRQRGLAPNVARARGVLLMIGKIPEMLGLARFHLNRLTGQGSTLIEYKSGTAN